MFQTSGVAWVSNKSKCKNPHEQEESETVSDTLHAQLHVREVVLVNLQNALWVLLSYQVECDTERDHDHYTLQV